MWRHSGLENSWWCGPGSFFPGPFGFIVTLLFWGFTIYLVVKFIQYLMRPKMSSEPTAIELLQKRYAKGEIDKEEYDRIGQELIKGGR